MSLLKTLRTRRALWSAILGFVLVLAGGGIPLGLRTTDTLAQQAQRSSTQVLTQVPLQIRRSRVSLDVMVNGQGPFAFGLDTGASGAAWVTRALVKRLNLPVVDGSRVSDGSGVNSRSTERVRINAVKLGDVLFEHVLSPVLGDGPQQEGDPEPYGTIGFEMFRDYLATYDYPGNQLRIASGALPKADGNTILSYVLDHGSPSVEIQIGNFRVRASIDTGNIGGILLPMSFAKKVPLRTPLRQVGKVASSLGEFDLYRADLDGDVQIGEAIIREPGIFFSDLVQQTNLGRDVMHEFAMTFDQRNRRVRLQRPLSTSNSR